MIIVRRQDFVNVITKHLREFIAFQISANGFFTIYEITLECELVKVATMDTLDDAVRKIAELMGENDSIYPSLTM